MQNKSNNYKKYENRYVFFIDVLGFSQKVKDSSKPSEIIDIVDCLKNDFIQANEEFKLQLEITQVSDCIIISFEKSFNFILHYILYIIAYVQANALVKYGLLFRGGGTYGKIIHNQHYLFGEAYNRAYNLESKYALYPRVIIDKQIIEELKTYEKESCMEYLQEEDIFYYVDYIKSEIFSVDTYNKKIEFYLKLKEKIENVLHNNKNENVIAKYKWLIFKYNDAIKSFNKEINKELIFINENY